MADMNKFLDGLDAKTSAQTNLLSAARANYAFIGEQLCDLLGGVVGAHDPSYSRRAVWPTSQAT